MEQIEILQGRLKPNEEIIYKEDDGVFIIRLEIKRSNSMNESHST